MFGDTVRASRLGRYAALEIYTDLESPNAETVRARLEVLELPRRPAGH